MTSTDRQRLSRLRGLTKLLFAIGLIFLAVPFIGSLLPTNISSETDISPWHIRVDLSTLPPGEELAVDWPGGPVRILHRSVQQQAQLQDHRARLQDPASLQSIQPEGARNPWRSLQPAFFVYLALESSRKCTVRSASATHQWPAGFDEACQGARFDLAGRLFSGTGNGQQHNLTVPPHQFTKTTQLQLLPQR